MAHLRLAAIAIGTALLALASCRTGPSREEKRQTVWRWTQSRANPALGPNSLLTGKITGNFTRSDTSNYALLLGNPRPEPIFSHHPCFRRKSEQGINRDGIRELTGAHQGKNRELFLDAFRAADPTPSRPDLVIRHPPGRERCSGRCQLQKSTTRKFHGFLLWSRLA